MIGKNSKPTWRATIKIRLKKGAEEKQRRISGEANARRGVTKTG